MAHDHSHHGHSHHDHYHPHGHSHGHGASKNILVALLLNASFTVIELVGGVLTGSVAILADAIHDLGDTLSLALAYGLQRYSLKRRDSEYTYGYGRFSMLSALLSGTVLVAGSVLVVREALPKLWQPHSPHADGMIGLAILGIAVNGFAAWRMARGKTSSEKILTWHLMEDALGWAATFVGAFAIRLFGWTILDPLLALGVAAFVLWNAVRNLREVFRILLQGMPTGFDAKAFEEEVRAVEGVAALHDLHGWSLDGVDNVLSLHVVLKDAKVDVVRLKKNIAAIAGRYGGRHVTIETEIQGDDCVGNCDDK